MAGEVLAFPCANHNVSDNYWDHVNRGSVNPGTDFTCAYGSDTWAAKTGTVTSVSSSPTGSGGRFITILYDDGTSSQYLHLSSIDVWIGMRVAQFQHVAYTGASAYGSNYGTQGPHLHFTYRIPGEGNVDPEVYIDKSAYAGGVVTPIKTEDEQEEESYMISKEAVSQVGGVLDAKRKEYAEETTKAMAPLLAQLSRDIRNTITRERDMLARVEGRDTIWAIDPTTGNLTEFKTYGDLLKAVEREQVSSFEDGNGQRQPEPQMSFKTYDDLLAYAKQVGHGNVEVAA